MLLRSQALDGRTLKSFRLHLHERTMVFIDSEEPELEIFAIAARSTVCNSTVSSGHSQKKIFFVPTFSLYLPCPFTSIRRTDFKEFQITLAWANNGFYWLGGTWVGDFRFNSYRSADLLSSCSSAYGRIKVKT